MYDIPLSARAAAFLLFAHVVRNAYLINYALLKYLDAKGHRRAT
jgi:hypothetical protein